MTYLFARTTNERSLNCVVRFLVYFSFTLKWPILVDSAEAKMKLEKPSVMKWLIMKQRKDSWKSGRFRFQRYAVRIITKFLFKTFIYHRIERTNINKKRGREWPIKNKKNNRDKLKTISKQIWTKVGFGDINVACSSNKVDNNKSLSLSLSLSL